jgi:hypothetical protein
VARFEAFLNGRAPDESLLREYLRVRAEWVGLEFKAAQQVPVMGIRKTISAFANGGGGDLFLGVDDRGIPTGTSHDSVDISHVLRQEGAPVRDDCTTNLVDVVRPLTSIPLSDGSKVYWIDVAAHGHLVAALKLDGTLGLYIRPGAESEEARGFEAVDLFRNKTRARLLTDLYDEFARIVGRLSWYPQGPAYIREDTVSPVRRILESDAWSTVANKTDKTLLTDAYLGKLLSLPMEYAGWLALPYREGEQQMIMRKNDLDRAVRDLRTYLVNERALPPESSRST